MTPHSRTAPGAPAAIAPWLVWAWLLLLVVNLLIGNAWTTVWDQDEAAYAGFASDMVTSNHWVVPQFPYTQAHRKTPLTFWLIAGSFKLLGVSEFALRLPSVLATLGTIASVWFGGRFIVGRTTAQLAAILLGSSLFVVNLGKLALTDNVLLLCETIAALALLRGCMRPSWKATLTLWIAVAAGLLAKGPPILILVGGMFVFLFIVCPRRWNLIHLHPWFGVPLALVPLAIWIQLAWAEDQRYVLFLGYWYVLRRIGGATLGQSGPPGTHFVCFFIFLLPWSAYLLSALGDAWRGVRKRRAAHVLLAGWLFGGWMVWELLASKLPTYALGAYPALALLIARQVRANLAGRLIWTVHRSLRAGYCILVGVSVALSAAAIGLSAQLGVGWLRFLAVVPAGLMLFLSIRALLLQRRGDALPAFRSLLLGFLAANIAIWLTIVPAIDVARSVNWRAAQEIARRCPPGTTVAVAAGLSSPSFPFYVRQAGLGFRDLSRSEEPRERLNLDLSPLLRLRFREIERQVRSQTPPALTEDEKSAARLEGISSILATGEPAALVLDDGQYSALKGRFAGAEVLRPEGWLSDRFKKVRYTIVIVPAAAQRAADPAPKR
ncbi:MAG: glycosyltransferase family 39 protein [Phycisphaerae bacterium]